MKVKMISGKWAGYLTLAVLVLALIQTLAQPTLGWYGVIGLVVLGFLTGWINISIKERGAFVLSVLALAVLSGFVTTALQQASDSTGVFLAGYFANLLIAFGTAALSVAMSTIYATSKSKN